MLTRVRAMGSTNGWSAVGGQTNSAYVEGGVRPEDGVMGHSVSSTQTPWSMPGTSADSSTAQLSQNPCGASTGSAVGVSAGFAPIALGTEVDGSLVQPSARSGLYALKPTIGSTELGGIFAVSEDFDALGGMAKSVLDLAHLTELVLTREERAKLPADGYLSFLKKDFSGLRVGFVDPELWRWPETVQHQHGNSFQQLASSSKAWHFWFVRANKKQRAGYAAAMERSSTHGATVTYPVSLPAASEFMLDGQPATITAISTVFYDVKGMGKLAKSLGHVFRENVESYFSTLSSSEVRSLPELVQYNKDHSDKELPHGT